MLPVINSAPVITPAPVIVATTVPGNNVLRVAPDNVAPNVSAVPVGDNTRRGGGAASPAPASTSATTTASGFSALIAFLGSSPSSLSLNASTTFMAQLMSQDNSPYARSVMSEYEKLVALSQVKYKPSNASLPEPEPSSVFSQILKQEQQAKSSPQPALMTQAMTASAQQNGLGSTAVKAAAPLKETSPASANTADAPEQAESQPSELVAPAAPMPSRPMIMAYLATISRNDALKKPTVESV